MVEMTAVITRRAMMRQTNGATSQWRDKSVTRRTSHAELANRAIARRTWIRGAACRPADLCPAADAARHQFRIRAGSAQAAGQYVFRRSQRYRAQFQGTHLRLDARQYHRPGL